MKYQAWSVATSDPAGRAALEQAGVSPLLAAVLSARGMDTAEQARQLLFPPPRQLSDPLLIRDMDKAVQRVRLAMERGEKVAVYGDYDVDGITSTCLLTDLLVRRGVPGHPLHPQPPGGGLRPEPGGRVPAGRAGGVPDRHRGLRHHRRGGDGAGPLPGGGRGHHRPP